MSTDEIIEKLVAFNKWRRGEDDDYTMPGFKPMPNPIEVGKTIDAAVELLKAIEIENENETHF